MHDVTSVVAMFDDLGSTEYSRHIFFFSFLYYTNLLVYESWGLLLLVCYNLESSPLLLAGIWAELLRLATGCRDFLFIIHYFCLLIHSFWPLTFLSPLTAVRSLRQIYGGSSGYMAGSFPSYLRRLFLDQYSNGLFYFGPYKGISGLHPSRCFRMRWRAFISFLSPVFLLFLCYMGLGPVVKENRANPLSWVRVVFVLYSNYKCWKRFHFRTVLTRCDYDHGFQYVRINISKAVNGTSFYWLLPSHVRYFSCRSRGRVGRRYIEVVWEI